MLTEVIHDEEGPEKLTCELRHQMELVMQRSWAGRNISNRGDSLYTSLYNQNEVYVAGTRGSGERGGEIGESGRSQI